MITTVKPAVLVAPLVVMTLWSCDSGQVVKERERKDLEALEASNAETQRARERFVWRLSPEVRLCRDRLVRELETASQQLVALRKRESDLLHMGDDSKLSVIRRMVALVEATQADLDEQVARLNVEIDRGAWSSNGNSSEHHTRVGHEVIRSGVTLAKAEQSAKELRRLNGDGLSRRGWDVSSDWKSKVEGGGNGLSVPLNHIKPGDLLRVVGVSVNESLNVREKPNPSSRILFSIPSTASGVVYRGPAHQFQTATWYRVQFGGGVGFANGAYLSPQ